MSQSFTGEDRDEESQETVGELPAVVRTEDEIIEILLSSSSVKIQTLIPPGPIKSENAVKVALWIITNCGKQSVCLQRIKWLIGIVQYGIIDSVAELYTFFAPFIQLIYIRDFHAHVCHLLYLTATPDLYKWQIERITRNEQLLGLTKPLAGLLSRLKSLRPDLVPQTVPHQSSAASFPKLPPAFRNGLYALSEQIKETSDQPVSSVATVEGQKRVTKKMRLDIIPQVEHVNLKSSFEVDFRKLVLLSQFESFDALLPKMNLVVLPNHIGSLLGRRDYHHVLAFNFTPQVEVALSQWLYLTLCHEFLEKPQQLGSEGKELLLDMVIQFQQTTGRKLMVVYDFLADYFKKWDGIQYGRRIWQLLADCPFLPYADLHDNFLRIVESLFANWDTPHRLIVIRTCTQLIRNLLLQKFGSADRARDSFKKPSSANQDAINVVEGTYVISEVIRFTERLLNMGLTSAPSEFPLIYASLFFYTRLIDLETKYDLPFRTFCQPITVYAALFSMAPVSVSMLCRLLCKYGDLGTESLLAMDVAKELDEFRQDALQNASILNRYLTDTSNCLVYRKTFDPNSSSMLKVPQKNLKILRALGDPKSAFDLTIHPAFTGAALVWWETQSNGLEAANVYDAVGKDPASYVKYLLTNFPDISAYIRRFHRM